MWWWFGVAMVGVIVCWCDGVFICLVEWDGGVVVWRGGVTLLWC